MVVDVLLAGWEIECCRPPPGVGDRVDWPLLWVDDDAGPGAVDLRWQERPAPAGHDGRLLAHGPLTAWWPAAGDVPAHGRLVADLHGGAPGLMPSTTGTVTGVHVVTQTYRLAASGAYLPLAGAFDLRPVTRGPTSFSCDGGQEPGREPPDVMRQESGVLVTLAVPPSGG